MAQCTWTTGHHQLCAAANLVWMKKKNSKLVIYSCFHQHMAVFLYIYVINPRIFFPRAIFPRFLFSNSTGITGNASAETDSYASLFGNTGNFWLPLVVVAH
jgi:hypothetical protein